MSLIENLAKERKKLSYTIASKGKEPDLISITEIPKNWTRFLDTKDRWIAVEMPESENATACLYHAKAGTEFPPHFHNVAETIYIVNPEGEISYYTPTDNGTIVFPNGVHFPAGKENRHFVKFIKETIILIIWKPKFFKGWDADFSE